MKHKYKVGDKVIITGNTSGHAFRMGEKVILHTADNSGIGSYSAYDDDGSRLPWWFTGKECRPIDYGSNKEAKDLLEVDY